MGMTEDRDRARKQQQDRIAAMQQEPDFFLQVNHLTGKMPDTLGKYGEGFASSMATVLDNIVRPFSEKRSRIKTSGTYTAAGERQELGALVQTKLGEIAARRDRVRQTIGEDIKTRRAVAARPTESKEDPQVRYWRQREIRDHVKTLDLSMLDSAGRPLNLMFALDAAIARGVGSDWLEAIESAPVPIVEKALTAGVRNAIADGSDPELEALSDLMRAHETALNFIERGILDAAKADGVDVSVSPPVFSSST